MGALAHRSPHMPDDESEIHGAPVLSIERTPEPQDASPVPQTIPFLPLPVKIQIQLANTQDGGPAILLIPSTPAIPDGIPFLLPADTAKTLIQALAQAIAQAENGNQSGIIVPKMAVPQGLTLA